jgi:hypothetical protein
MLRCVTGVATFSRLYNISSLLCARVPSGASSTPNVYLYDGLGRRVQQARRAAADVAWAGAKPEPGNSKVNDGAGSGLLFRLGRGFFPFDVGDAAFAFFDFIFLLAHMSLLCSQKCIL